MGKKTAGSFKQFSCCFLTVLISVLSHSSSMSFLLTFNFVFTSISHVENSLPSLWFSLFRSEILISPSFLLSRLRSSERRLLLSLFIFNEDNTRKNKIMSRGSFLFPTGNVLNVRVNIRNLTKPRRRRQRERQKTIGLMSKTTALHVHHAFLYISLPSLHNYTTWNAQTLSLLGNGNGKAINSTISVRTWARSPLFSSSQNPRLLRNRANWDNREKV